MKLQEKQSLAISAAIEMRRGNKDRYDAIKQACFYTDLTWHEFFVTLDNGERIMAGIILEHDNMQYWYDACYPDDYYMQGINCKTGESVYAYCANMQIAVNSINEKRNAKTA